MKECRNCNLEKPESDYSPLKTGKGGLNPWCKECRRQQSRAMRVVDGDRIRARERNRLEADPAKREAKRASNRKWIDENRELHRQLAVEHYWANRDSILRKKKAWRAENRYKIYVNNGDRRAVERRARLASANPKAMAALYRVARRLSVETGVQHHVDHIVPLKHDLVCGLHVEWNMEVTTAQINMAKGNKWIPC